jgi:hypothetical protein
MNAALSAIQRLKQIQINGKGLKIQLAKKFLLKDGDEETMYPSFWTDELEKPSTIS